MPKLIFDNLKLKMTNAFFDILHQIDARICKAEADTEAAQTLIPRWQPIETAPRDGTLILLWATDWPTKWVIGANFHSDKMETWWVSQSITIQPTYWMPLPDPPEAT